MNVIDHKTKMQHRAERRERDYRFMFAMRTRQLTDAAERRQEVRNLRKKTPSRARRAALVTAKLNLRYAEKALLTGSFL